MKSHLTLPLVAFLAFLGGLILNAAPTEGDYRKVLADKITAEAEGRLKLVAFKTTNAVEKTVGDVPVRSTDYEAELEFLEDTKWNVHPGIQFQDFRTWKMVHSSGAKFDTAKFNDDLTHPGQDFIRGSRARIQGTIASAKLEGKWSAPEVVGQLQPPTLEEAARAPLTTEERAAQSLECLKNLKQAGLAMQLWLLDNRNVMPTNWLEMRHDIYNPTLLICPGDTNRVDIAAVKDREVAWKAIEKRGISYETKPLGEELSWEPSLVIMRCPVHGNHLTFDGKVVQKLPDGSFGPPR